MYFPLASHRAFYVSHIVRNMIVFIREASAVLRYNSSFNWLSYFWLTRVRSRM